MFLGLHVPRTRLKYLRLSLTKIPLVVHVKFYGKMHILSYSGYLVS